MELKLPLLDQPQLAAELAGLRIDKAPQPGIPSMTMAIENFIKG